MISLNKLHEDVRDIYSKAAESPNDKLPFPLGRMFAESIGYPGELLDLLPATAIEAFTGVSNVSIFADIPEGSKVLDIGCGAGLDSFIASKRAGHQGAVTGIDFSGPMILRARQALSESGIDNIVFHVAEAERLPVENNSIDVALVNGIFNLSPERELIFRELSRVLRKGGKVYSAELILNEKNTAEPVCDINNWFA